MQTVTDVPELGRQPWTSRDLVVLGSLSAVAAVAIAIGALGVSNVQPVAGLALLLALAYCVSSARHAIDYRTVAWGLTLQFLFALIVLKTGAGRAAFQVAGTAVTRLLNFAFVGSSFVFGPLGNPDVWPRIMTNAGGRKAPSTQPSSRSRCCRPSSSSRRFSRCCTSASCRSSCAPLPW